MGLTDAEVLSAVERAEPTDAGRWLRGPGLVFLAICLVYLAFPSSDFNADALHYNLRALMTAGGASGFLGDESVPVHLAWHAAAAGLLRLAGTQDPLSALHLLVAFNNLAALLSIFVFLRLATSIAGDFAAGCATVVYAFSHACLRSFLSLEVYALNNLVLLALLWYVHRCCARAKDGFRPGNALVMGVLTMAAILAHLSNLVLVPVAIVFFCVLDLRRAWWRSAIFLAVVLALFSCLVAWIAAGTPLGLSGALGYLFHYGAKDEYYAAGGPLRNASAFLRSAPRAALGSLGPLLYVPLAVFAALAARHARDLWASAYVRFLCVLLAFTAGFYSQWDAANIEHKIALVPILLLLLVHFHALPDRRRSATGRVAVLGLVALFVVVGFLQGILPFRRLADQELYRLSAAIHEAREDAAVVVVGLASESAGHPVVMAGMTFFGQRILLLDPADPGFQVKIRAYRHRGMPVLIHEGGRFRAEATSLASR